MLQTQSRYVVALAGIAVLYPLAGEGSDSACPFAEAQAYAKHSDSLVDIRCLVQKQAR